MAFYGYGGDVGECHWPSYDHSVSSYHSYPIQSPISHPSPNWIENRPNYYYNNYHDYAGYPAGQSEVNHFVHRSGEPKLIQYDGGPAISETKYTVSYSTLEKDDTDFDEYDPDPYSGGYDISETYGKPLPPSDQTCYPRSTPLFSNSLDSEGFSYGSVPSKDTAQDRDIATIDAGTYRVANVPYGSGLENVDICDGIFGYWPCWEKYKKGDNGNYGVSDQEIVSSSSPWNSTADYLFGSPFGYGGDHPRGEEGFGDFSYGTYYQQQHH